MTHEDIRMMFKIMRYCGLRVNEACKLDAADFDLELREVNLHKTKTNRHDFATIPKEFLKDLEQYLKNKSGILFPTNRDTVYYWLMQLGRKLDIAALTTPQSETGEKTKCHIFRKSIGKDMINQGLPANIVMAKLRHKDLGTTTQYLKLNLADVKQAEENLTL